jgi:hypothetical protein
MAVVEDNHQASDDDDPDGCDSNEHTHSSFAVARIRKSPATGATKPVWDDARKTLESVRINFGSLNARESRIAGS